MEKDFAIEPNREQRIIIDNPLVPVTIELVHGDAEIFGCQMALHKTYSFFSSFAVYSQQGCKIRIKGQKTQTHNRHRSTDILKIHKFLEEKRDRASQTRSNGPIVLVTGKMDSGKSTLCRTLLNFAANQGRNTIFMDLDVGQSSLSIPGTMSMVHVDQPTSGRFDQKEFSVYFFGYKSPSFNGDLYYQLIQRMGSALSFRAKSCNNLQTSGAIIDTCGWTTGMGYQSILVSAESFNANVVIVIDDRTLCQKLQTDLSPEVEIIFIHKLAGAVVRSKNCRKIKRDSLVKEYFYGDVNRIKPYTFEINYSELNVFKACLREKSSALSTSECGVDVVKIKLGVELLNQVLALSYADKEDDILLTCIYGFVCVVDVDVGKEVLIILSPQPKPLPTNNLLLGDILLKRE